MADLSDDLRADLCRWFLRGFLDFAAGAPVEDDDLIPVEVGAPLIQMAEQCIGFGEPILAELFRENPQQTYEGVYAAGVDCAKFIAELGPKPICLN